MKQDNTVNVKFKGLVYLYFEKHDTLHLFDFDENGNYKQISPRKNRASANTEA